MAKNSAVAEIPFDFFLRELSKFEDVSSFHNERVKRLNLDGKYLRNYGAIILKKQRLEAARGDLRKKHDDSEFERLRKVCNYFKVKRHEPFGKGYFYDEDGIAKDRDWLNPYYPLLLYDVGVGKFKINHTIKGVEKEDKKGDLFDRISIGFWEDTHYSP